MQLLVVAGAAAALRTSITCPVPECVFINAQATAVVEYQALPAPLSRINVSLFRRRAEAWDALELASAAPLANGYFNLTQFVQPGGSQLKLCFYCGAKTPVSELLLRIDPDAELALGRLATTEHTDSLLAAMRRLKQDALHVDSQYVFRANRQAGQKSALRASLSRMGIWSGLISGVGAAGVAAYQLWFVRALFSGKRTLL